MAAPSEKKAPRARKKEKKNVVVGVAHVAATFNNTIITITDGAGNAISVVVAAASTFILIDPSLWAGVKWLKVRSGTSGSPVNQTVNPIQLIVRPVA